MEEILDKFLGLVPKEDLEKLKKLIEEKDKKIEELQQAKEERLYDLYAIEEDIKILENMLYDDESFEPNGYIEIYLHKNEQEAIKHLIEAYRKVKEEELHWKGQYHLLSRKIDVIPKSKVKEKIEELEKELEEINEQYSLQNFPSSMKKEEEEQERLYWELTDNIRLKIKVLQELLEEE